MKILFLSHYFPPEVNAPATRTYEHAVRWVKAGHDVTVVTCAPNCPDGVLFEGYLNPLRGTTEFVDGIRVLRTWTYLAPNAGTLRRILNYLSYLVSAVLMALRLPRPDVVVATSPQFFCGWAGVLVARCKRVPLVLEIRDIWPESIEVLGALRQRTLLRLLEWLERRMYRAARHIVCVGQGYRDNILSKVNVADRISVITNGVDLARFQPTEPDERFQHWHDLEDKFVCSYVGTIGMAHGLEIVVEAARLLRQRDRMDIAFCLVGDGAARETLEIQVREAGLEPWVRFTGRLPKEDMPMVLANSDACLVHLRKCELFTTVLPSKIFETMAMARPILTGVEGEARRIVLEAGAGVALEPENAEQLAETLERMADQPAWTLQLGAQARQYVARHFNRDTLAAQYLTLLTDVAGKSAEAEEDVMSTKTTDHPVESEATATSSATPISSRRPRVPQ